MNTAPLENCTGETSNLNSFLHGPQNKGKKVKDSYTVTNMAACMQAPCHLPWQVPEVWIISLRSCKDLMRLVLIQSPFIAEETQAQRE